MLVRAEAHVKLLHHAGHPLLNILDRPLNLSLPLLFAASYALPQILDLILYPSLHVDREGIGAPLKECVRLAHIKKGLLGLARAHIDDSVLHITSKLANILEHEIFRDAA